MLNGLYPELNLWQSVMVSSIKLDTSTILFLSYDSAKTRCVEFISTPRNSTAWQGCKTDLFVYQTVSSHCQLSKHSWWPAQFGWWLSVRLWTKWLWVRVQLQSLKLQILRLLRARSFLTLGNYRVWIHSETRMWHNKNIHSVEIVDLSNKLLPLLLTIVENGFLVLCLAVGFT